MRNQLILRNSSFPVTISSTSPIIDSNINPLYIHRVYTIRVITSMVERIKLRVNNLWNFSQFLSTPGWPKMDEYRRIAAWTSCQHPLRGGGTAFFSIVSRDSKQLECRRI